MITSHQRRYDVILSPNVHWEVTCGGTVLILTLDDNLVNGDYDENMHDSRDLAWKVSFYLNYSKKGSCQLLAKVCARSTG